MFFWKQILQKAGPNRFSKKWLNFFEKSYEPFSHPAEKTLFSFFFFFQKIEKKKEIASSFFLKTFGKKKEKKNKEQVGALQSPA